jgi:hypothetical protein
VAVLVIGGSAKDIGKTALVCGVISALREFSWTAVKITAHEYEPAVSASMQLAFPDESIQEEMQPGVETDTARYLSAGARRALLVTRFGTNVPINQIEQAVGNDPNVIFESNRIVEVLRPDICLAFAGAAGLEMKPSFMRLLQIADAVITLGDTPKPGVAPPEIPLFRLQALDPLSPELLGWLRSRLGTRSGR